MPKYCKELIIISNHNFNILNDNTNPEQAKISLTVRDKRLLFKYIKYIILTRQIAESQLFVNYWQTDGQLYLFALPY